MHDDGLGSRLRFARGKLRLSQHDLAARSGGGDVPDLSDVKRLADTLHVHEQYLRRGDMPKVPLWEMSVEEQHRAQTGLGTEGLPDYVIVEPGPSYRDDRGSWRVSPHGCHVSLSKVHLIGRQALWPLRSPHPKGTHRRM